MLDCKCSFAITLIKDDFACEKAQLVTRRGGADIACISEAASNQCASLLTAFKGAGLPAFDAKDDLLETPYSVFAKIQFGGLLGLACELASKIDVKRVENIFELASHARARYDSFASIPHQKCVKNMLSYKITRKKRGRKN